MSNLSTYAIPLRGGLDLNSPRFSVTPGTLRGCLNFETFGVAGYSVIEGFHRYDGTYPCFTRDWVIAEDTGNPEGGSFQEGELLSVNDNVFGVCILNQASPRGLHYLITNQLYAPLVGDTITGETSGAVCEPAIGQIKRASQYYDDQYDFLNARNTVYTTARELKQSIFPYVQYNKNIIPHGLHWYKDRLYAVIDHYKITFENGQNEAFPGDILFLFDESDSAVVIDIKVTSGSWANGDAEGEILVRPNSAADNTFSTLGALLIRRPNGATAHTDVAMGDLVDFQLQGAWGAGIYRSVEDGDINTTIIQGVALGEKKWAPIDMGWEIDFTTDSTCTAEGIPTIQRWASEEEAESLYGTVTSITAIATSQVLGTGFTTTNPMGAGSLTVPAATALKTVLQPGTDASYVSFSNSATVFGTSGTSAITAFDFNAIPTGSIITGFSVSARLQSSTLTSTPGSITVQLRSSRLNTIVTNPSLKTQFHGSNVTATYVLGASTDMWGTDIINSETLLDIVKNDNTFGVALTLFDPDGTAPPSAVFRVLAIDLTVYYRPPVDKIYAYDPVTDSDIKIEVPYYILRKGQFAPVDPADNGQGTAIVYNLEPLDASAGSTNTVSSSIQNGWQLRTATGGGGTKIANVSGNMRSQMLPTRSEMDRVNKNFEIITANFYSQENYEAFYGADGVGPAFQYDGNYFFKLFTKLPIKEDHPSHVAFHRGYLCLSYDSGQLIVSAPGEPTNFDPVEGSTLYSTGDKINGLLTLEGTALGIFCESSIQALLGNILGAFDDNDAVLQVVSPFTGALEYSVVAAGKAMFLNSTGVNVVETTDKYGEFTADPISYKITPYLDERVNDKFGYQAAQQNFLFAEYIRSKKQTRYYFKDGDVLTCTLPTADRNFEFTRQRYTNPKLSDHMIPVASCTGTGNQGTDLLFMSFQLASDDETSSGKTLDEPEREMYIYHLDRGTCFDLAPIDHYAQINFMSIDDPTDFQTLKAIQLEILGYNYFNEYIKVAKDYQPFSANKKGINIDPVGQSVLVQREPAYLNVGGMDSMGKTIAIEIGGRHIYPGYVMQAMAMWYIPQRTQFGASPTQAITKGN